LIVKICGIKRREDLFSAAKAGCDFVGFITGYSVSPRNLVLDEVFNLVSIAPEDVKTVVVCPASAQELIEEIVSNVAPYAIQVHGEGRPKVKDVKLIRAVQVTKELSVSEALAVAEGADFILLDSPTPGSGKKHDWGKSKAICLASPIPVILSGGLNPDNVCEAIRSVAPAGVDVSSGVELYPGVKDPIKMEEFVKRARACAFI